MFDGSFNIPENSALSHFIVADKLLNGGHPDQARLEAKTATALCPDFFLRTRFLRPFVRKASSQTRRCASTKPRCIFIKLCIPNFKAGIYLLKIHFRAVSGRSSVSVGRASSSM